MLPPEGGHFFFGFSLSKLQRFPWGSVHLVDLRFLDFRHRVLLATVRLLCGFQPILLGMAIVSPVADHAAANQVTSESKCSPKQDAVAVCSKHAIQGHFGKKYQKFASKSL